MLRIQYDLKVYIVLSTVLSNKSSQIVVQFVLWNINTIKVIVQERAPKDVKKLQVQNQVYKKTYVIKTVSKQTYHNNQH